MASGEYVSIQLSWRAGEKFRKKKRKISFMLGGGSRTGGKAAEMVPKAYRGGEHRARLSSAWDSSGLYNIAPVPVMVPLEDTGV